MSKVRIAAIFIASAVIPIEARGAESELHIEARGTIQADYAIVTNTFEVEGRGKPAAEATLKARLAALKANLLKSGIPESAVTISTMQVNERKDDDFNGPSNRFGFAEAVVALEAPAEYGTADPEAGEDEFEATSAEGADSAAMAAHDAAKVAANERRKVRKAKKLPFWDGQFEASVRIDNLRLYPDVARIMSIGNGYSPSNSVEPTFRFNNPETVHSRAVATAVAKARMEADVYAKAVGGRVVRIARTSNTETPISAAEMLNLFSAMDNRTERWKISANHAASVAIDFIISTD